jgi:hypothetical protein
MSRVLGLFPSPVNAAGPFRHMAPRDAAVWQRFLTRRGADFLAVAYDVALGGVVAAEAEPALSRGWQYSTALKIDAVLWSERGLWIVEVRPWATVSAVGAALCYTLVAQRERLSPDPMRPMIVCEGIQPDVAWVARELAITVEQV